KTSLRTAASTSRTARSSAWSIVALSACATGNPAVSRLAIWRVASASSASEKRRRRNAVLLVVAVGSTPSGTSPRARSAARAAGALSASTRPFSVRPSASTASKRNDGIDLSLARHAQQLFPGGDAGVDPALAVLGQPAEAARQGELDQPLLAGALMDGGAHRVVDLQQLVDAGAAEVAALQALRAAAAAAIGAELAHQALRQDAEDRGGEQERLDAHVQQPRDGG